MGTEKKKILRRNIWQEDLEKELSAQLADGFDLRGIRSLSKRSRREGEPEQYFYRVTFERHTEEIQVPQEKSSIEVPEQEPQTVSTK